MVKYINVEQKVQITIPEKLVHWMRKGLNEREMVNWCIQRIYGSTSPPRREEKLVTRAAHFDFALQQQNSRVYLFLFSLNAIFIFFYLSNNTNLEISLNVCRQILHIDDLVFLFSFFLFFFQNQILLIKNKHGASLMLPWLYLYLNNVIKNKLIREYMYFIRRVSIELHTSCTCS